ncbi:SDR family NAD(P)-dependent oxidoreductase [Phenylobacterium immobile]|uniref:SDR family NAD(P)-dependent oxidoreductase n=1 Tax=Phenylobacterium immobile TaxID=21 RepID=UPI000B01A546|nr:SDR family NAD(P)-dependent oxidoreductase [Phenylobacterium immobile]
MGTSFAERRFVITGASSGLGRRLALDYAAPGVFLALTGRHAERLAETAAEVRHKGAEVVTAVLDAGDGPGMKAWLESLEAEGPIDILIANAGVMTGPAADDALDGFDAAAGLIRTNLLGVVYAVEAIAPFMIARRRGQICVIASTASFRGLPYMPAYAASKAGARIYGESVRGRLAPLGVSVTVASPGFFASPMTERFHGDKPLMVTTQAAADRIRRALDKRAPRTIFPRRIALLLRLLDLLPASVGDKALGDLAVRIGADGGAR